MTKTIRRPAFALVCCFASALCLLAAGMPAESAPMRAENAELSGGAELESSYVVGSEIRIPDADLVWDGRTYDAESMLYFPGGNAVSAETVVLEERGKYTLEYRAETETGILLSHKLAFVASDPLYSLSGRFSSAQYGTVPHAEERPGVVAALASGESLLFNQRIDLNGATADDTIAELFVAPQQQGLADALNVVFLLTDADDPSNTVTVTAKRLDRTPLEAGWQERNTYVTANAVDQMPTGLELNGNGTFVWEGGTYILHQNNIYGAGVRFSMSGVPGANDDCSSIGAPEDIASQSLRLSMDYENRRVYMNGSIVADLDDVTLFPLEQWQGFENGECYLSIYATSYNQERFNCVVTQACGASGEALASEVLTDNTPPELEMIYGEYAQTGFPDAVAGIGYPVPEVRAYDAVDRETEVSVRVYCDYGARSQVDVTVRDGVFVPAAQGVYTIVYTSSDLAGNVAELRHEVRAAAGAAPFGIRLGEHPEEGETGVPVKVAEAETENAKGIPSVSVRAICGDVIAEIPTEGKDAYTFLPLYAGTWEIEYTYSDYMESKTHTYEVEIKASETPYIGAEAVFPKYFIRGAAYDLPELYGYEFGTGTPVSVKASAFLSEDGGAETQIAGSRLTTYAEEQATVIYRLGSGANAAEKRYTVPVVDVGYDGLYLRIADYFVGSAFEKQALDSGIEFTTRKPGTQSFEFINPVQVFNFRMSFRVLTRYNDYDAVHIYLTDSENPDIAVKASYLRNTAGNSLFRVNDGAETYTSTGDFVSAEGSGFSLYYTNGTQSISPSADYSVAVRTDAAGNPFAGFPSGRAYIRVELSGIDGEAGVEIRSIDNQVITRVSYDLIRPEISMSPVEGEKYLGDRVVIRATQAGDVLDPDISLRMRVTKPDGSYAVSEDGVVLDGSADPGRDYVVTADSYGRYSVSYECSDMAGNNTIYSYVFNVVDTEPPEVSLGDGVREAGVGDTVYIAEAVYRDNYTECTMQVKLRLPDGRFIDLPGRGFAATAAGEYTVFYFVYDATYNVTCVSYTITVS